MTSINVILLVKKAFRFGVVREHRMSSKRKKVFKTSSSMDHGLFSNVSCRCSEGILSRQEAVTETVTINNDIDENIQAGFDVFGY